MRQAAVTGWWKVGSTCRVGQGSCLWVCRSVDAAGLVSVSIRISPVRSQARWSLVTLRRSSFVVVCGFETGRTSDVVRRHAGRVPSAGTPCLSVSFTRSTFLRVSVFPRDCHQVSAVGQSKRAREGRGFHTGAISGFSAAAAPKRPRAGLPRDTRLMTVLDKKLILGVGTHATGFLLE